MHEYDVFSPFMWLLFAILFATGITGNIMMIKVNMSLRHHGIINMALTDILIIMFCLPASIMWDMWESTTVHHRHRERWIGMCQTLQLIQAILSTVSNLTLIFNLMDTLCSICYPDRYKIKICRGIKLIFIVWMISILINIPDYYMDNYCRPTEDFTRILIIIIFFYTIPLLLWIAASFKMMSKIRKTEKIIQIELKELTSQKHFSHGMETKESGLTKTTPKPELIVDDTKNISEEEMKNQLRNSSESRDMPSEPSETPAPPPTIDMEPPTPIQEYEPSIGLTKTTPKPELIVDDTKNISEEEMKNQLRNSSESRDMPSEPSETPAPPPTIDMEPPTPIQEYEPSIGWRVEAERERTPPQSPRHETDLDAPGRPGLTKTTPKPELIVDDTKNISEEEMKNQLRNSSESRDMPSEPSETPAPPPTIDMEPPTPIQEYEPSIGWPVEAERERTPPQSPRHETDLDAPGRPGLPAVSREAAKKFIKDVAIFAVLYFIIYLISVLSWYVGFRHGLTITHIIVYINSALNPVYYYACGQQGYISSNSSFSS